jgi:hypothetical protein
MAKWRCLFVSTPSLAEPFSSVRPMSVMSSRGQSCTSSNLIIVILDLGSYSKSLSSCLAFVLSPSPHGDVKMLGANGGCALKVCRPSESPPCAPSSGEGVSLPPCSPSSGKGKSSKRKLRSSQMSFVCCSLSFVVPPPPLRGGGSGGICVKVVRRAFL